LTYRNPAIPASIPTERLPMTADTPRRAVMADVAVRAGVSVMTVSRVLNGFSGVTEETRARVEEAVNALGYQANTAARVLAGGRSRTLE